MSMENRKRPAGSTNSGNFFSASSFPQQPARALIVEALPPWWSETCKVFCDSLDNFLSLACSLNGPCRIPLLSLYAISRQQECLLPFVVHGNLARLRSCVEELRSLPGEGCIKGARAGELLRQAVLDSLQQFKQYIRHTSAGGQSSNNSHMEVTVVTCRPGPGVVHHLEMGLKDADLVSLKRLLVVQIYSASDWGQDTHSPEDTRSDTDDCVMLATEMDLQRVENSVFTIEMVLKAWLQDQGGDREHLHLLLPCRQDTPTPVCVKCDMQESLISPTLIPLNTNLGGKAENIRDFLPVVTGSANQSQPPQRLKAVKTLRADGVCQSVLYGLPLVLRPTTCWHLDWDEMENNINLFQALCHSLRSRDLFLLLQVEPEQRTPAGGSGVYCHYVLQPSPSLSLLLKPVASRELLLPCSRPVSTQEPACDAMHTVQVCLSQLDEECVFNPLSLSSNLYQQLRSRGLSQPRYPYRLQPAVAHRNQSQPPEGPKTTASRQPPEGPKTTASRQPRQPQNHGRQPGMNSKVRATVAPLPSSSSSSSSSLRPPPAKASRPALTLLSSSSGGRRQPAPQEEDEDDDDSTVKH